MPHESTTHVNGSMDKKYPRLRRIKITKSRKPDLFGSNGRIYFINGVIRNEHFSHITPMTESQTEAFFEDRKNMTSEELHAKWSKFSIEKSEEVNALIHGPTEQSAVAATATSSNQRIEGEDNDENGNGNEKGNDNDNADANAR